MQAVCLCRSAASSHAEQGASQAPSGSALLASCLERLFERPGDVSTRGKRGAGRWIGGAGGRRVLWIKIWALAVE